MNNKYAFWKYDKFPFVLGGECFNQTQDNKVFVPSYGGYFHFLKIVDLEKGKKIHEKLNKLKQKRDEILQFVEQGIQKDLLKIMAEID